MSDQLENQELNPFDDFPKRWRVSENGASLPAQRDYIDYHRYVDPEQYSTLDYTTIGLGNVWQQPRWPEVWFPDAFAGPMAELLCALEDGQPPTLSGHDNLITMALVDACYRSVEEHRAVEPREIVEST